MIKITGKGMRGRESNINKNMHNNIAGNSIEQTKR